MPQALAALRMPSPEVLAQAAAVGDVLGEGDLTGRVAEAEG